MRLCPSRRRWNTQYTAPLYDDYFYTPTSSNHALDLDSKSDSGGTAVWNGNIARFGHNRGSWPYFGNLKYVQVGDTITYKTSRGTRTYRVCFAGRIPATDTAVLNPTAGNQLTMLTCIADQPSDRFCVIGQEM